MNIFKLLMVDDNEQDLSVYRESVTRYKDEKNRVIELIECKTVDEAFDKLDNTFDGAIIDLKLDKQGDEGTQVIDKIVTSNFRIPIAILTGTPGNEDPSFQYIGVYKKGETAYSEILDVLWNIYNTGLTRIMGGRGEIEKILNKVFINNIIPQKDRWIIYGKADSSRTEKALLRYILNHLLQLLDRDEDKFFPEEFYISPPLIDEIRTGSIVRKNGGEVYFVVLNPACDLVIRGDGNFKTDRILLVQIDDVSIIKSKKGMMDSKHKKIFRKIKECRYFNPDSESAKKVLELQKDEIQTNLSEFFRNTYSLYYQWLPETIYFKGGLLNFRKLITLSKAEFEREYELPKVQIAPNFVKDIIYRFSSFYARQGQPDIEYSDIISQFN